MRTGRYRWNRRSGAPLWALLLLLVVLPLTGTAGFALVMTQRAGDAADASVESAEQVQAYGLLARAVSAVDREQLTVVLVGSVQDPVVRAWLGVTPESATAVAGSLQDLVTEVRADTDARLDAAVAAEASATTARDARTLVAGIRDDLDGTAPVNLAAVRTRWSDVSDLLRSTQNSLLVSSTSLADSTSTVAAIRDVRLVADLSAAITPDVVDYLGWRLHVQSVDGPTRQLRWLESHTAVALARSALTGASGPAIRVAARTLAGTPEARDIAARMESATDEDAVGLSLDDIRSLVVDASGMAAQTIDLLDEAVERAASDAASDGAAARSEAAVTVGAALAATAGTVLVLWLVGRWITRALRRLAEQAAQISQGRLVAVGQGGPREVRTVGRALDLTVGGLRRVQAQAQAVARGDLDDPVLDEPLPGPLGDVLHSSVEQLVFSLRQRDRLQVALSHQAAHDPLTDLPNRARALELATAALHRGRRAGAATGLLFVDLDGFKGVNDRAGHAAGDAVLREVATRMRLEARAGDTVCRLGGDEFVVLVEAVADVGELVQLGERLVAAVSQPLVVDTASGPRSVAVGASIGVALAQDGEVDGDELLAQADAAVYRAKHAGRGRVEVFDDGLRAHIGERRDVEEALRRGLTAGEVHVLYQPVLDVASGALVGFEALARWDRPGVGLLAPEAFVPVAEQSDLIAVLDRWVLHAAVTQLASWRTGAGLGSRDGGPTVSVNVSARFLGDPHVTDVVLDCLVDAGLPARCLVLEVAEGAVVESPLLLTHLAALRGLGVGVALDDFGTGTTSIGQLRHLPVDTLKVDGRFLSTDPADQRLVALMVATAHASGLTVVAEGVEHAAVLDRLAADSCDAAQGYHLSVPLDAPAAGELFRAGASASVRG